jgi:hypothetical protein
LEIQLQDLDLESYIQDLESYIQQEEVYIQQEEAYIQQEEDHCRCRHCCYQSRKKGSIATRISATYGLAAISLGSGSSC